MARVLIVDDEENILNFLTVLLQQEGHELTTAASVGQARGALDADGYDLVLCDLMMPDGSGLELLEAAQNRPGASPAFIVMTAYATTKTAIEAMRFGAYDYISKPFDVEELKILVSKALAQNELRDENVYLRHELATKYDFSNIIGRSPRMREIFELIERVAATSSTVLIQGESGTGKELIARAIHFASDRADARFLSLNCGALPENLLESELFGHERGAFTGAVRRNRGMFQEASNGTLFLDEIGEMSTSMQVKLLRALQEKKVRPVGGSREEEVDVRIITATNQDLEELVRANLFRKDLYYRVNVIPLQLPPLRRRREDIPLLTQHFIAKYSRELGIEDKQVTPEAMEILNSYDWPGNVRELENMVERVLALCPGGTVNPADLPATLRDPQPRGQGDTTLPQEGLDLERHLDEIRRDLMMQALDRHEGVQTKAAEVLGMSFRSFRYYAKKCGLT